MLFFVPSSFFPQNRCLCEVVPPISSSGSHAIAENWRYTHRRWTLSRNRFAKALSKNQSAVEAQGNVVLALKAAAVTTSASKQEIDAAIEKLNKLKLDKASIGKQLQAQRCGKLNEEEEERHGKLNEESRRKLKEERFISETVRFGAMRTVRCAGEMHRNRILETPYLIGCGMVICEIGEVRRQAFDFLHGEEDLTAENSVHEHSALESERGVSFESSSCARRERLKTRGLGCKGGEAATIA